MNDEGCTAALAANTAGMATLGIDRDKAAFKQAVRDGVYATFGGLTASIHLPADEC